MEVVLCTNNNYHWQNIYLVFSTVSNIESIVKIQFTNLLLFRKNSGSEFLFCCQPPLTNDFSLNHDYLFHHTKIELKSVRNHILLFSFVRFKSYSEQKSKTKIQSDLKSNQRRKRIAGLIAFGALISVFSRD